MYIQQYRLNMAGNICYQNYHCIFIYNNSDICIDILQNPTNLFQISLFDIDDKIILMNIVLPSNDQLSLKKQAIVLDLY